jgi:hypothetical protein
VDPRPILIDAQSLSGNVDASFHYLSDDASSPAVNATTSRSRMRISLDPTRMNGSSPLLHQRLTVSSITRQWMATSLVVNSRSKEVGKGTLYFTTYNYLRTAKVSLSSTDRL